MQENSEEQAAEVQETKTILALWDSLTAGYWLQAEESYPAQLEAKLQENGYNYEVINAGTSGDTSSQLLWKMDFHLSNHDPDLAIVVIGWNDWLRGQSTDTLKSNIWEIVDTLQAQNIPVVLGWMQVPPNLWISYFREFKGLYADVAKEKDTYLIDFFLEWVATRWVYNLPDGIHPNADGYAIIVENVYEFLKDEELIEK